jgi:hypothetical protein
MYVLTIKLDGSQCYKMAGVYDTEDKARLEWIILKNKNLNISGKLQYVRLNEPIHSFLFVLGCETLK